MARANYVYIFQQSLARVQDLLVTGNDMNDSSGNGPSKSFDEACQAVSGILC
jgi:hypothetical protein